MTTITSTSENDTVKAAQDLAATIAAPKIILLNGTLGMGKTVFARALIRALSADPDLEVLSPTFTLLQTYDCDTAPIYHYDLYRIEEPDEILQLGWEEACYDAITIIEWPERLGAYKPSEYLDITLSNSDNCETHRKIHIQQV
ncbi:MAG: tRNA (adenosine(37)-N6)-threonylcarbamoyltransferase complex ATPase subunit type 1 TsaE [Alphaproteobacteria bacterium]|nr:tRNA (adenosine(37)-N6)-threonylcarbamoyltransferase complex ATPase subunit type 1 TsaE [Alphaproteobacteria bacterium]